MPIDRIETPNSVRVIFVLWQLSESLYETRMRIEGHN